MKEQQYQGPNRRQSQRQYQGPDRRKPEIEEPPGSPGAGNAPMSVEERKDEQKEQDEKHHDRR